ncbi:MAG TPA: tetratricopeptide repeat protein [Polyangia bacterium]|nr:tetratricopeptide repeat protein [Polyangia bacterium]
MGTSTRRQPAGLFAVTVAVGLGALMSPGAGQAQPDKQAEARAKEHVHKATEALSAGRYDEATTEFEAGYAIVPLPAFVLNMGHAQRQAGNLARAREYYQKFLRLEPKSPERANVEKIIAEIDASAASTPSPRPPAPTPAGGSATAPTTPPVVGEDSEIPGDLKLTAREPPEKQNESGPAFYRQWWFWGTVAGAIVAGAAAFFFVRSSGADYTTSGTLGTLGR